MSKHKHRHQNQLRERRKQFVQPAHRSRAVSWNVVVISSAVVFLAIAIFIATARDDRTTAASARAAQAGAGGDVVLPVANFADGQARFYRYATAAGREIRFVVMKNSDGVVRAAFDTCDVCYRERRGYRQVGDNMVCNNCGKAFRSVDVNVLQGGCNPAPLERIVRNDQVVLTAAALDAGAWYF